MLTGIIVQRFMNIPVMPGKPSQTVCHGRRVECIILAGQH